MSVETDFRVLLAARPGITSLVGDAIALNAVNEGDEPPYVVYGVAHAPVLGLDNTVLADQCSVDVACWAGTAAAAGALADQVQAAVAAAPTARGACVVARNNTFDPELGLDGVVLSVEWWA
jgi:hypothetical protein